MTVNMPAGTRGSVGGGGYPDIREPAGSRHGFQPTWHRSHHRTPDVVVAPSGFAPGRFTYGSHHRPINVKLGGGHHTPHIGGHRCFTPPSRASIALWSIIGIIALLAICLLPLLILL